MRISRSASTPDTGLVNVGIDEREVERLPAKRLGGVVLAQSSVMWSYRTLVKRRCLTRPDSTRYPVIRPFASRCTSTTVVPRVNPSL